MAVAVALIRGFIRNRTDRIGNFWVDLVRSCVRILLPLAVVGTIVLLALGAVQNFSSGTDATTLAGVHQTITGGPVASQEAIKELGTNGGGFYNANSAHPFENPNAFSNILEIFLLLLIPVCLTRTFGLMVKDKRQGYAILAAMGVLWAVVLAGVWVAEATHPGTALNLAGASMEGKETRFGVPGLGAVRHLDHRHVDGCGQLLPRLVHLARRRAGHLQHGPGRGRAGRRRHRALRDAGAGHRHGVHRRADGRAHPGVPAQEDHRARDQAGLARTS